MCKNERFNFHHPQLPKSHIKTFYYSPIDLYLRKTSFAIQTFSVSGAGRYNDGYGDTYGSPYDATPFQTVPSGANSGPDQWGHNHDLSLAHHAHGHPAFLSAGMARDQLNAMQDTKPMIQNGMIAGYPSNPSAGGPCFTGRLEISIKKKNNFYTLNFPKKK